MEKRVKAVPPERAATSAEIEAAIAALTDADWYRLRAFAEHREFVLQERAKGRDLLGEAFERLLRGSRKWDKTKAGFLKFLFDTMSSISNAWFRAKGSPTEKAVLGVSLVFEDGEGNTTSVIDEFPSPEPDKSYLLDCEETLKRIDAVLADDEEAQMVLEGFRDGRDPAGIREVWGFSQTQYNAITTRMRRKIQRAGISQPRVGASHVQ
jgi:DNA-directed RNA polymerase specialized sigma24 family protein